MSEHPKVYGHCDAGCKRRVVPYEEYLSSATFIVENQDSEGTFVLEQGKTYKISNSNDTTKWGFEIRVSPMMKKGSYTSTPITWGLTLPAYDKYDNYIKFRWLELILELVSGSTYNIKLVCEMNGVRQTVEYSQNPVSLIGYDISTLATKVRVYNATNCWIFNEDAEIVGGGNGDGTGEGTPGKDGISPTVEVTEIAGGHKVSVTDKNGTQDFEVMDGEDGEDGFSPKILTAEIQNGYRIRITDKTGTNEIEINNGTPGENGTSVTITDTIQSDEDDGINTVIFSDGTMLDVKNGSRGATGSAGKDGTSVTVSNVTTSSADGGSNVVTFSDGKTLTVKNGSKGSAGANGKDGATAAQVIAAMTKDTWTFTLEDGSTVTKVVPLV